MNFIYVLQNLTKAIRLEAQWKCLPPVRIKNMKISVISLPSPSEGFEVVLGIHLVSEMTNHVHLI